MSQAASIEITLDITRMDISAIHAFLSTSYWSPNLPRAVLERAMAHSICVGAFDGSEQIGFGRAITDSATFAYLADVYVLPAYRHQGLAKRMLTTLLADPRLQGLRRKMLVTRDAHALYAQLGFQPLASPERLMESVDPQVYDRSLVV